MGSTYPKPTALAVAMKRGNNLAKRIRELEEALAYLEGIVGDEMIADAVARGREAVERDG